MATATSTSWISKKEGRCGGDACVRDTRITVWGLVAWKRLGQSDDWIREGIPDLTQADLDEAWRYAADHADEIDECIRLNEED